MKNTIKNLKQKMLTTIILVAVFFFGVPGIELLPQGKVSFDTKKAEAAIDYGRETRTAEFVLGLGTEITARATGVTSYTSATGWVTAAPNVTSGDVVKLLGKNIHVDSAQLEVGYYATAVDITKQDIYLNVENSASTGLVAAGEYSGMTASTLRSGGLTGHAFTLHEVTSFFDRQTDAQFLSGVNVVASLNVTGPTRFLTSMKIVITYSVDVEVISHDLVKTVHLPLLSATDRGTMSNTCAASATCIFTFDLSQIPELTSKTQIQSVGVEMFAQQGATTVNSSFSLRMTGSGTSRLFTAAETYTDAYTVRTLWNPLSDALFTVGGVESIDVVNGTTALYALGGEVAITFSFDATAVTQTDTVNYFVSQGTTLPVGNLTQLSTSTINIVNQDAAIKTAWYRVGVSPSLATANVSFAHRVSSSLGNSNGTNITYALNTANVRAANTPTIIHVLDESSSMYTASADIGGQYQFSSATSASSPASVSAFITFTWNATDPLLPRTKTAIFGASQKGPGRNAANNIKTASTIISLAEHSEKTQESVFLESHYTRSDLTSVTGSGNHTAIIGTTNQTIAEGGIVEPYRKTFLTNIIDTNFFGASTSSLLYFPFSVAQYFSGTDFAYDANYIFVTYNVAFTIKPDSSEKQMRTVEYVLGGGTDNTARATNVTVYFGDNAISASPAMLPLQLLGSNVRVKHAYVDVSFMMVAAAAAQTTNELTILGSITGAAGSEPDMYLHESSASQFMSTPSGITGYYHGQHDVTSLFDKQVDDGYWNRGDVQVKFGIATNQSTGNRTLTAMKLVVTYETDFNLGWHDEIKTVHVPLQSSDSLGTRAAACARNSDCSFTYSRSIPDLVSVVSAHFEMTASMDGTTNPSIYLASGGAQSPSYIATEANNDSTAIKYLWEIPIANLNAVTTPGQTGTLIFHNGSGTALNFYGIGGELVITYRYNTASPSQLETVAYPVGQQLTGVAAKTAIGTASPYIANAGATVRDVWLKYYSAPYATGNITLYGKLGAAVERSIVAASTVATRSGGERTYFLNLSADVGSFALPSTNITANIAFTTGAQYPTGAEAFVNYVWDGSKAGTTTRTILFSAAQHSGTNVTANAPQVKQAPISLPALVPKVFRGAYSRTMFQQSAGGTYGGTFALGPAITYGINNATTSITSLGDLSPYNDILIRSYTQSNLFGSVMPSTINNVRVENSAQAVNPFRFSNEIIVSYDEAQEQRRAAFTQDMFRFYMNEDNITPSKEWHTDLSSPLGESQAMTASSRPVRKSDAIRLRIGLTVGTSTLAASQQIFQLQYGAQTSSCSAIDIDWQNVATGGAWTGFVNPTIYTNTPLSTLKLSKSNVAGLYSEDGLTVANPNAVNMDQMVEYDWAINRNTALPDTDYCFRVVEGSGKKLSGYSFYPVIHTAGYTGETTSFRWYDDELHETPLDNPLWLLNQSALSVENNNIVKLRVGLQDAANEAGSNEKFALQWSADPTFNSGGQFVTLQGLCTNTSTFCYSDSPSLGDDENSVLSTAKLGLSLGRHNEATTTSNFSPAANSHYEMEFSIKPVRQRTGQTYYFRLWDTKRNIPLNVKSTYSPPSLAAEGATLGVTVSGVNAGINVAGNMMSVATTNSTLPFGKLVLETSSYLAHLLNIKTNAMEGYTVSVLANDDLRNTSGGIIPSINASNNVPKTWSSSCLLQSSGCVGYHTTDNTLNPIGDVSRFGTDDSWAELATTTPAEVAFSDLPTNTTGENVNVVYRIEPHIGTAPGQYSTNVVYIVTPVY